MTKIFFTVQYGIKKIFLLEKFLMVNFLHLIMKEVVNRYLLAEDKFMPETHLTQPGFTYSTCRPFAKNKN